MKTLVLLCVLLRFSIVFADDLKFSWTRSYPGSAVGILETTDSTFYIGGTKLLKLSAKGDIIWEKNFTCTLMDLTADGGIILLKGNEIVKMSAGGEIEWSKNSGGFPCIKPTADGGYIAIGTTYNEYPVTFYSNCEILVARYSASFDLEWSKVYSFGEYDDFGLVVIPSSDSNYVIGARINDNSKDNPHSYGRGIVMKIDRTGNMLWKVEWIGSTVCSLYETTDHSILCASELKADNGPAGGYLHLIRKDGRYLWRSDGDPREWQSGRPHKTWYGDALYDGNETRQGTFLGVGKRANKVWILELKADGWERNDFLWGSGHFSSIIQTQAGDYLLTGVYEGQAYIARFQIKKLLHVPAEYATIQQAIDAAMEGDTVLVAPGTYNLSSPILNNRINHLTLKGSRRDDGSNASIVQASVNPGTYVGILFKKVQNCRISGFEVRFAHSGISVDSCKFCEISHNYVHDNDQANSFHGNGIEVFHSEDIGVYFNIIDHHEYHGIDVGYGNKNVTIQNNTVLRTFRYDGICISGPYVENITIKNNIIAFSTQEGIALIKHNPPSPVNFVNDYNCFWQNGLGPIEAGYSIGPHSLQIDPRLVDFTNQNYSLQSESPCLGAGEGGVQIGALGYQEPEGSINQIGEIQLPLPGGGVKVRAMGENVCCTDYVGKLVMVNVADPTRPRLRGQIEDLPGSNIHELWCTENYAFTAHRFGGINLINVANPDSPQVITTAPTNYCHAGLYSVGNYLYYGEHCLNGAPGGIRIFDFAQATLNQSGAWFGEIDGRRLIVTPDGNYIYQTTSREKWPPAKMVIYDVTDKAHPQLVNSFNVGNHAKGLALSGDDLYLNTSDDWNTAPTGLQIWDITNRTNPELVTSFNRVKGGLMAYDPTEQVLFTTTEGGTLYALDVTRPEQITVLDSVTGQGLGWLDFQQGYLYVGSTGPDDQPPFYLKIFKFSRSRPTAISIPAPATPADFMLSQNYPNPFNPACHLRYQLPVTCKVQVIIYNLLGQAIRTLVNAEQAAGNYEILWDGNDQFGQSVTSGIYYCQMQANAFRQTRKLILLR